MDEKVERALKAYESSLDCPNCENQAEANCQFCLSQGNSRYHRWHELREAIDDLAALREQDIREAVGATEQEVIDKLDDDWRKLKETHPGKAGGLKRAIYLVDEIDIDAIDPATIRQEGYLAAVQFLFENCREPELAQAVQDADATSLSEHLETIRREERELIRNAIIAEQKGSDDDPWNDGWDSALMQIETLIDSLPDSQESKEAGS